MKLNPSEQNAFEVIWLLIKIKNIKITATSLKKALSQHNDFPSFVALSDILHEFNVPNLATRISPEQLSEVPLPAIAYFDKKGSRTFVTVTNIENGVVEWIHNKGGVFKESVNNFIQKWQGVVLLIEADEASGEANYQENRRQEIIDNLRFPFALTAILACLAFFIYSIFKTYSFIENWHYYSLLVTKSIGLIFSIMLVWYSIDSSNLFLRRVCQINESTSCSNILNSKAAKIFGWLTWSEIGLFYFAGGFLSLLIYPNFLLSELGGFAVLALPYTLWSIYYQAYVVREWCPLCLAVQAVILIEFGISIYSSNYTLHLDLESFSTIWLWGLFPIFWSLIKKPLQKSVATDNLFKELQRVKFNIDYMQTIMSKVAFLPPIFDGMKVIEIGNPSSENTFLLILNPICTSCRQTYNSIKKIVQTENEVNAKIILAGSLFQNDLGGIITRTILSQEDSKIFKATDNWFSSDSINRKKWMKDNHLINENQKGIEQMSIYLRWLEMADIGEVPTTFYNSVEIPSIYTSIELIKLIKNYSKFGFTNQQ